MSASRMEKQADGHELRPEKKRVSYADSESSNSPGTPGSKFSQESPVSSKTSIKLNDTDDEELDVGEDGRDDEDELQSADVIHGMSPYLGRWLLN